MQAKIFNFGPVALSSTLTTNILNPPTATGGTNGGSSSQYIVIKHFRIVNKTSGVITVSFWKGATGANAAGTELIGIGLSIAPNVPYDACGMWRFDAADFLVGGCNTATAASIKEKDILE